MKIDDVIAVIIGFGLMAICVFIIWFGSIVITKMLIPGLFLIALGICGFYWLFKLLVN